MTAYSTGHVKRDPASKAVATRTVFPDAEPMTGKAWLVATVNLGARFAPTADVETWDDLYTPEA